MLHPLGRGFAVLSIAVASLVTAGCASSQPSKEPAATGAATNPGMVAAGAVIGKNGAAVSYNKALVPDGAKVVVAAYPYEGSTTVVLNVRGLQPDRTYGSHVHTKPCGPTGDDAGPHAQHMADPVKPSVDPKYANPQNEVWLDFKTDAQGNATSAATVPWVFASPRPGSVVIHAEGTQTGPGKAGTAGAREACVSVRF